MKKRFLLYAITLISVLLFSGCGKAVKEVDENDTNDVIAESESEAEAESLLTILYTNDIHSTIDNAYKTDENGEEIKGLSYANVAAMKKELEEKGQPVILVDTGDFLAGTSFGAMDEGRSVVSMMNDAEYDVVTFGNHDFDYGMSSFLERMDELKADVIASNFCDVSNGENVFESSTIVELNGIKIGFVGVTTPRSLTSTTPSYFMNEERNEYVYGFCGEDDGRKLYDTVQCAVDEIRDDVDYVILLSHLGEDDGDAPYRGYDVIQNTHGIDAVIDGHSHTVIEGEYYKNDEDKDVLITQTGNYFANIGVMNITEEGIRTKLVSDYEACDGEIDTFCREWFEQVNERMGIVIAKTDCNLAVTSPDTGERMIRSQETNLGDLVADAFYYHFNNVEQIGCDISVQNGGGIRTDVANCDISYNTCKEICPYGNVVCLVETDGQTILDALEWSNSHVGKEGEFGGFLQVAGIRFDVDTTVESTVQYDKEKELWQGPPTGEYRVKNVQVYNRETGEFEDLDLDKKYSVAGVNYILRNLGDGYTMFENAKVIKDFVGEEYMLEAEYIQLFGRDEEGNAVICTKFAPIHQYVNYPVNYENPYGSERINIIME